MVVISGSRQVDAPASVVWGLLSDVEGYPRWVDATDRILEAPRTELDVGYRYREYGGLRPFKGESDWEITEWQPMTRQVHLGDDGFVRMDLAVDLGARSAGTEVSMAIELTPRWFLAPLFYLLWPLFMRSRARETMRITLDQLKAALEPAT